MNKVIFTISLGLLGPRGSNGKEKISFSKEIGGNVHEVSLLLDTVRVLRVLELVGDTRQRTRDSERSRSSRACFMSD
jgi:hypothetical protein